MKIELLNSEGPVLTVSKHESFSTDESRNFLLEFNGGKTYVISEYSLRKYLSGKLSLVDSSGRTSIFTDYPESMKIAKDLLREFLE